MKVVVIGGGVAGLATACSFRKKGYDVVVAERAAAYGDVGIGFIILPNGLRALDELGAGKYVRSNSYELNTASIRNRAGQLLKAETLIDTLAVKRSVCIEGLVKQLPAETIRHGFDFSHFEFDEHGNISAVVSTKGEKEIGDVFIAADGAGSKIRKTLFPDIKVRDSVVRELVGIAASRSLAERLHKKLLKTQSSEKSLSMGMVPCSETEIIWYIQFDSRDQNLTSFENEMKEKFAKDLMKDWPDPINEVLNATDFSSAFLWQTKDVELPESFHTKNLILIGDAAHLALPFSSQGTGSAMNDAIILAELFEANADEYDLQKIFTSFYNSRKKQVQEYIQFGRTLEQQFLNPKHTHPADMLIPLAL